MAMQLNRWGKLDFSKLSNIPPIFSERPLNWTENHLELIQIGTVFRKASEAVAEFTWRATIFALIDYDRVSLSEIYECQSANLIGVAWCIKRAYFNTSPIHLGW